MCEYDPTFTAARLYLGGVGAWHKLDLIHLSSSGKTQGSGQSACGHTTQSANSWKYVTQDSSCHYYPAKSWQYPEIKMLFWYLARIKYIFQISINYCNKCNQLAEVVLSNNIHRNANCGILLLSIPKHFLIIFNELPADLSITCGENWKTFCSRARGA